MPTEKTTVEAPKLPKKTYNFNIMIMGQGHVFTHWVTTDINLLEAYKNSIILGSGHISWEKGAIDTKNIVGIMDMTV